MSLNRSHSPLLFVLAAYLLLATLYAWATPPLEASDEREHMGMIYGLLETGALPVQRPGAAPETWWEQEGSQPPLYYALGAVLISPLPRDDWEQARAQNPHAMSGVPGAVGNKNRVLPSPSGATAAAVYVLRAFSIALGLLTLAALYHTARYIAPEQPAVPLLAVGLAAFNPMFLFIAASVNNDNLVTALSSLAVFLLVRTLHDGFRTGRSLAIALLVALAALSKLSGLVLVPAIALSTLIFAARQRRWRDLFVLGGSLALALALLMGWWLLRNIQLYGELFGTATMAAVAGPRLAPFTFETLFAEFEGFRIAYWGLFGAVNILTFDLYYKVMDALTLLAIAGLIWTLLARRREFCVALSLAALVLIVVTGVFAVVLWTAQTYASQGRLLFPYMAAICPLLALGLAHWWQLGRARALPRVAPAVASIAALGLFALAVPFTTIRPAYTPPPAMEALPPNVAPVYARFGTVALVGYQADDRRYGSDDRLPITVYWQVLEQASEDLSLYLHAVDQAGTVLGRVDSYPGAGLLRTSTWQPGSIYADRYVIPLDEHEAARCALRVQVGWWNVETGVGIPAVDASDSALTSVMLEAGAFAGNVSLPAAETPVSDVVFGGLIALDGYSLSEDAQRLILHWNALSTPPDNYTVFAQVLDAEGVLVGQGDAAPALPTRYWLPAERDITEHTLTYPAPLPPGTYTLIVGWYRATDFARLATVYPHDAYPLVEIRGP